MKILRLTCAENIIRDVESGQVMVYNLYDEIQATAYPILLNKFCIYILAVKEEEIETYKCIFKIINSGDVIFQDSIDLNFRNRQTAKSVIKFSGLAVPKNGELKVEVYTADGQTLLNQYPILLSLRTVSKKITEE